MRTVYAQGKNNMRTVYALGKDNMRIEDNISVQRKNSSGLDICGLFKETYIRMHRLKRAGCKASKLKLYFTVYIRSILE